MVIPLAAQVGIGALKVIRLPRWGSAPLKLLLFTVIPLQATRSIAIYGDPAVTRMSRWGSAPAKLPLFGVISVQATRSIAIYGDRARSPGGDWRLQNYSGALKVNVWGRRRYIRSMKM